MAETLGTARIDIVVGTEQLNASIQQAQTRISGLSSAAQADFAKMSAAQKRVTETALKNADTFGKTRQEVLLYNAALKGLPTSILEEMKSKLLSAGAAAKTTGSNLKALTFGDSQLYSANKALNAFKTNLESVGSAARKSADDFQKAAFNPTQLFAANKALTDYKNKLAEASAAARASGLAQDRIAVGVARENGVRDRLSNLLATERGQRILAAQATTQHATALGRATVEFNKYGVSAKQNAAALRGVPAQLTDIFTSLASGQRPFTVLLQQGGQLKDMFGGIVPAARALGGAIAGLINPLTLAAAAVVGLGLAWKSAADEQANFEKALILTGNQADLTSKQLRGMASSLDDSTNVTTAKASEVLAQVAATGKFTADQIGLVAEAAINLEDATGRSIEQTVREFAELRKDPVDAIKRLSEAVGDGTNVVGFLTPEIRRSIEALKDQGDEAGAAALAIDAYAGAINEAAPQVVDHLSSWSKLWRDIKFGVGEATDAVKGFFRESTASTIAAQSLRNLLPFRADEPTAQSRTPKRTGPVPNTIFDNTFSIPGVTQGPTFSAVPLSVDFTPKARPASAGGGGRSFGGGSSRSSARELPDFSKQAADELERLAAAEDRATESFLDLQAQLEGPMAVAMRDHQKRVEELNALAAQSPEAAKNLSAALELEAERHKAVTEELKAQQEPWNQTLASMRAQLDMIGMGNTEQAVANDLMREGIDLSSQMAQAKLAEAHTIDVQADAQQNAIGLMDQFRQSASDSLADIALDFDNAGKHAKEFFDNLAEILLRWAADQLIAKAFGAQGSNGAGTSGGGFLGAILGAFTGAGGGSSAASGDWFGFWKNGGAFSNGQPVQAFANGGIVSSPTMFPLRNGRGVMGEADPEAIMPLAKLPNGKLGVETTGDGGSRTTNNYTNFYVPDLSSRRNQQQVADRTQRLQSRATARN